MTTRLWWYKRSCLFQCEGKHVTLQLTTISRAHLHCLSNPPPPATSLQAWKATCPENRAIFQKGQGRSWLRGALKFCFNGRFVVSSVGNSGWLGAHLPTKWNLRSVFRAQHHPLQLYLSDERLNAHLKFKWTFKKSLLWSFSSLQGFKVVKPLRSLSADKLRPFLQGLNKLGVYSGYLIFQLKVLEVGE